MSKLKSREIKKYGFALIEVIVSIVILSIVLSAAIGLLFSVGVAVEKNKDRLTATYLAQECLELVKNARDTSWKNYRKWDCSWSSDGCEESAILSNIRGIVSVDSKETKFSRDFITDLVVTKKDVLDLKSISGQFLASEDSKEAEEQLITCTVSWGEDKLSISQILTNWRKR